MTRITGGTIIDGTGRPAFVGDVLVDGDRIVDIIPNVQTPEHPNIQTSKHPNAQTPEHPNVPTIDATGCLVTPGFIDAHTHSDAYLVIEPDAPSKITQGVTTEINGMCGGSVAPRYGEARLSSDWAAILGERLTWHSLGEYREVLAQAKPAVNTVQFIGHNTLRSSVVGYAGRPSDPLELEQMKYLLEEALGEGGWGLTTGLIYQPGKYATNEEVVELARVTARCDGFYATHMRSESSRILEAIDEVIDLVRDTGIRAEISHLKTSGRANWNKIDQVIETIGDAVRNGILLGSDRYPFCASGTDLDIVLPDWAQEGAAKAECERLADPATRRRIIDEIDAQSRDWSTVMIGGTWHADNKPYSGKTVSEILQSIGQSNNPSICQSVNRTISQSVNQSISQSNNRTIEQSNNRTLSPGSLVCDILAKDGCKTGAFFFVMNERNLDKILAQPWIVPGSDASLRAPWGPLAADHPHPRAYATMPEFYRRLRQNPLLAESERTREKVIARMTSVPAKRFGLKGRGVLEKGAFADLVVWKEDEFAIKSTFDNPHQFTSGVRCVMVNGSVPYADGKFTGNRSGRFLERN